MTPTVVRPNQVASASARSQNGPNQYQDAVDVWMGSGAARRGRAVRRAAPGGAGNRAEGHAPVHKTVRPVGRRIYYLFLPALQAPLGLSALGACAPRVNVLRDCPRGGAAPILFCSFPAGPRAPRDERAMERRTPDAARESVSARTLAVLYINQSIIDIDVHMHVVARDIPVNPRAPAADSSPISRVSICTVYQHGPFPVCTSCVGRG